MRNSRATNKRTPTEKRNAKTLARFGGTVEAWITEEPAGRKYVECRAELKPREDQTLTQYLLETRATIDDFAEQIRIAESSSIDVESAVAGMRRDLAVLAMDGQPRIGDLFKLTTRDSHHPRADHVKAQGHVQWPVDDFFIDGARRKFQCGNAMLAWLFQDEIAAKLEAQIRSTPIGDNVMTPGERAARVAECSAIILEEMRVEERILCELEAEGVKVERIPNRSPLALLEIAPA